MQWFSILMVAFGMFMIGANLGAMTVESQVERILIVELADVEQMRVDCESHLPRNVACIPVLKFVPRQPSETD